MYQESLGRRDFLRITAATGAAIALWPGRAEAHEYLFPPFESLILYYHEISPSLETDIHALFDQKYTPISLEDIICHMNRATLLPTDKKTFHLTWDDGFASQYTVGLPIIEKINTERIHSGLPTVPVTMFIMTRFEALTSDIASIPGNTPSYRTTNPRQVYMTRDQIIDAIRRGVRVENHTVNHGVLPNLSPGAWQAEIVTGEYQIDNLYQLAGTAYQRNRYGKALAYPLGRTNGDIEAFVQSRGYDMALSTFQRTHHAPQERYQIGRIARGNLPVLQPDPEKDIHLSARRQRSSDVIQ